MEGAGRFKRPEIVSVSKPDPISPIQAELKQLQSQMVSLKLWKYEHEEKEKKLQREVETLRTKNATQAQVSKPLTAPFRHSRHIGALLVCSGNAIQTSLPPLVTMGDSFPVAWFARPRPLLAYNLVGAYDK